MIPKGAIVRLAVPADQQAIADLLYFGPHVHRHLDWRLPLEWLGRPYFWVLDHMQKIYAAFACPQDLPEVAWVRLFAHDAQVTSDEAWSVFWKTAQKSLQQSAPITVAVLGIHDWVVELLHQSGFTHCQDIVMLEQRGAAANVSHLPDGMRLRCLEPSDLPAVAELDALAFSRLWQYSLATIQDAYPQLAFATVVEGDAGLAGYQFSTRNPFGVHLARLAVRPDVQRQGVGRALVTDLLARTGGQGVERVSVNTQSDNLASLTLYQSLGFRRTGGSVPVHCFEIPSA